MQISGKKLLLECQSEATVMATYTLDQGETLIGRSSKCRICVPNGTVSRQHALIVITDDVTITDLNSRNGTFVNEEPISRSVVQLGQCIRLGSITFRLTDGQVYDMRDESSETSPLQPPQQSPLQLLQQLPQGKTSPHIAYEKLSPAQKRVFDLLLKGLSERDVADQLFISQHTVHTHARQIYRILNVHSRAELLSRMILHS